MLADHSFLLPDFRPLNFQLQYVLDDFFNSVTTERSCTYHDFVSNDSQTPPVNWLVVDGDAVDDFGCDVVRCADQLGILLLGDDCSATTTFFLFLNSLLLNRVQFVLDLDFTQPEVSQLQMSTLINHKILWF